MREIVYGPRESKLVAPVGITVRHNPFSAFNEITPFVRMVHNHDTNEQFGSKFSDFVGINIDVDRTIRAVRDVVINVLTLHWDQIDDSLLEVVKSTANLFVQTNPLVIAQQMFQRLGLEHYYTELDKVTGYALRDAMNLSTLPWRATRGDAIPFVELVADALFALKAMAVVASMGTAQFPTTLISQASAQMSQGTLGETELGRALLAIGGQAGYAALTNGDVLMAAQNETIRQGVSAGVGEGVKQAGGTELASVVGGAVGAGTTAELTGGSAGEALTQYGKGTAVSQAGKYGGVVGEKSTQYIIEKGFSVPTSSDASKTAESSSGSWFSLPDLSAPVLGNPITAIENIVKNISFSPGGAPSFAAPSVGLDIKMPEISIPDLSNLPLDRFISQKRAVKRGKKVYYQYILDDGAFWEAEAPEKINWWLIAAMTGGIYTFTHV